MYNASDPRFRRRLTELGETVENARGQARDGLFIVGVNCIQPCLTRISQCFEASCPGLNTQRSRRLRARSRGRAELSFDFYDDWDDDGAGTPNDELDRLLVGGNAGYGAISASQSRGGMSYVPERGEERGDKRGWIPLPDEGWLARVFGGARPPERGVKLKSEFEERMQQRPGCGSVAESTSSRSDLFLSDEDQQEDAVPLDDEFATVLERRPVEGDPEAGGRTRAVSSSSGGRRIKGRKGRASGSSNSSVGTRRTVSGSSVTQLGRGIEKQNKAGEGEDIPVDDAG
ncbi:hypothetical protein K470DRAFT_268030 [Piedraia hortae CBS 480.64]|uniref:Uncharacterized protein n=1 Tax=Piedraia hortae CBS 480.64 TaxID=1314780 RepID=A0A6A7C844_9PEZI|nr:hypothetical protein K470DRAFT_268030 [Piedraia hortae CBS 480.64]